MNRKIDLRNRTGKKWVTSLDRYNIFDQLLLFVFFFKR